MVFTILWEQPLEAFLHESRYPLSKQLLVGHPICAQQHDHLLHRVQQVMVGNLHCLTELKNPHSLACEHVAAQSTTGVDEALPPSER